MIDYGYFRRLAACRAANQQSSWQDVRWAAPTEKFSCFSTSPWIPCWHSKSIMDTNYYYQRFLSVLNLPRHSCNYIMSYSWGFFVSNGFTTRLIKYRAWWTCMGSIPVNMRYMLACRSFLPVLFIYALHCLVIYKNMTNSINTDVV